MFLIGHTEGTNIANNSSLKNLCNTLPRRRRQIIKKLLKVFRPIPHRMFLQHTLKGK
jgi:hypothetical protein